MRKIKSRYEEDKRRRRNSWIIGIILIIIMVFSTLGYSFGGGRTDNSQKVTFNGFVFIKQNDFWVLENSNFAFRYNPKETSRIQSIINGLDNYKNKPLYIFSENDEAGVEIYNNLFYQNQIVQRFQRACPEGEKCEEVLPTKTCEDNFIIIKEGKEGITQEDNCVFIEGNNESLVKNSDEFLFKVLRITQ